MWVLRNINIWIKIIWKKNKVQTPGNKNWKRVQFRTNTVSVAIENLGIVKKWTDKLINRIFGSSNQYEIQKLHFADLLLSLGEYYQ